MRRANYLFFIFVVGLVMILASSWASETPKGQMIFMKHKCNLCHSVSTIEIEATSTNAKLKGPDLVGLADRYKMDGIDELINQKIQHNENSLMKGFKGTDEELQALVDWLLEQKSE
jgi:cytochrome c5